MMASGRDTQAKRAVVWTLLTLPVLLFYGVALRFWTNLPVEDDYHALLGFGLAWNGATGWHQRLMVFLTYQHNEYKLFLLNAIAVAQIAITGKIHLSLWSLVGNLLPLVCVYLLWRALPEKMPIRLRQAVFVPVVWLFLNLNYDELLDWTLGETQVLAAVAFCLGSIYLLAKPDRSSAAWACALAFGACLANANAFLLAPVGLVFLLRKGKRPLLVPWIANFAFVSCLYLFHYNGAGVHAGSHSIAAYPMFFLTVVGCAVGYHGFYLPAVVLGILMVAAFVYATALRFDRAYPFPYWTVAFLLLSFALITIGRSQAGLTSAMVSRYRINSDLMLAMLYLLGVSGFERLPAARWNRSVVFVSVLVPCLLIGIVGDGLGYRLLKIRRDWLIYGMSHYLASNGATSPMVYSPHPAPIMIRPGVEEEARQILTTAQTKGLYRIPSQY